MADPRRIVGPGGLYEISGLQTGRYNFLFDGNELLANEDEAIRPHLRALDPDVRAVTTWRVSWQSRPADGKLRGEVYDAALALSWGTETWGQEAECDVGWGGVVHVSGDWCRVVVRNTANADALASNAAEVTVHAEPFAAAGCDSHIERTVCVPSIAPAGDALVAIPPFADAYKLRAPSLALLTGVDVFQRRLAGSGDVVIAEYPPSISYTQLESEGDQLRLFNASASPIERLRVSFALRIGATTEL